MTIRAILLAGTIALSSAAAPCALQAQPSDLPEDLTQIGLQTLLTLDIEVRTPSRKPQSIADTPAAIYIITDEEIRRSGATHVAELLRLVPGMEVARINSSSWAISSRGFNQRFAEKLLVMVDGQSIYTPLFGGTFWELQAVPLANIERIEVIRGPGASIWGANAMNGVINIITKDAEQTQGAYVETAAGDQERLLTMTRYGGKIGTNTSYRLTGDFADRASNRLRTGGDADDEWWIGSGGMRLDSQPSPADHITFQMNGYHDNENFRPTLPAVDPPYITTDYFGKRINSGANAIADWRHTISETAEVEVQLNYLVDKEKSTVLPLTRHTAELQATHRFSPAPGHDLIYGLEEQLYADNTSGNFAEELVPADRTVNLVTWFLQDEIALIPDTASLTAGSKFEYNEYSGFEYMPTVRGLWKPTDKLSLWSAISRAVRTPARVFVDTRLPLAASPEPQSGMTALVTAFGSKDVKADKLMAYEAGARSQMSRTVYADLALFYNDYTDLLSLEPGQPYVGRLRDQDRDALIIPMIFSNALKAHTYGTELSLDWRPLRSWRGTAGYSFIKILVDQSDSTDSADAALIEGNTPQHSAFLRSFWNVSDTVNFDALLRYVDHLPYGDVSTYFELDLRAAWQVTPGVELSVVGQNLLHEAHEENQGTLSSAPAIEIRRGVYGKITWSF